MRIAGGVPDPVPAATGVRADFRSMPVPPSVVVYRIRKDGVVSVLRVIDGRRDLGTIFAP